MGPFFVPFFSSFFSFGFYPCNDCNLCHFALHSPYAFDNDFSRFRILSHINCKSKNVIFSVFCLKCGPISVNFSAKCLHDSIANILFTIENNFTNPLSLHFHNLNHSVDDFRFQGLQSVGKNNFHISVLKWIKRFKTHLSPGIDSFIYFPESFRLIAPFSYSDTSFLKIKRFIASKFNISVSTSFSSFNSFKKLLCKSKL